MDELRKIDTHKVPVSWMKSTKAERRMINLNVGRISFLPQGVKNYETIVRDRSRHHKAIKNDY